MMGLERMLLEWPGEATPDDDELVVREREPGGLEPARSDRELDVVVRARLPAEEEVDRPAPCQAPGLAHRRHPLCDLERTPRLPVLQVRDETPAVVRKLAQIQRRQR